MNKYLQSMATFVTVAEAGSFSKAAGKLELSNSVVSHHITRLEEKLGVTLFYRTTRRVSLSDQGREFYNVASKALSDLEGAIEDLTTDSENPKGSLSIAMPSFLPDKRIETLIWKFAERHENINLNMDYSDDRQELISGGYDIGFRLGSLESTSLMARKISEIEIALVASPKLLKTGIRISTPRDIPENYCISIKQIPRYLTVKKSRKTETIDFSNYRIQVDNIHAARDAAVFGLGITPLPVSLFEGELKTKKLERVLPDWKIAAVPLFAVWNNKARRNSLTRRLLTFITDK